MTRPDDATWAESKMKWPWMGHEACQVHLLRQEGVVRGRICKACDVVEVHLLVDPNPGVIDVRFVVDDAPSGSA